MTVSIPPLHVSGLVLLAAIGGAIAYNCERLRGVPGSCYIFIKKPVTWQVAVFECSHHYSGELVILETEKESKAVRSKLHNMHAGPSVFYVGGITTDSHKSWIWYRTGQLIESGITEWEKGQPDNGGGRGENCAGLDFRPGHTGELADFQCDERHAYICEVATPDYGDYYGVELDERGVDKPVGK